MVALITFLNRHDERMLHALVLKRRALADRLMRSITHLGDAWLVLSVCAVLLSGVFSGTVAIGMIATFALVTSHLGVQILKRSISRPRPRLPVGCSSLIDAPDRFSFPSGHSAASLSIALPAAASLPTAPGAVLLSLAMLVGVSRCYLGVHYPGDVLTGWILAAVGVWIAVPLLT